MQRTISIAAMLCLSVLAIGVSVYLVINLSNQAIQQVNNVAINSFNLTGYNNPVGVVWNDAFALNYTNNGLTDIYNATITFTTDSPYQIQRELSVFDSTYPHYFNSSLMMGEPYSLGVIKAGESKEFRGEIWNNLVDAAKMGGFTFSATLKSKGDVLDQASIVIPKLKAYDVTCTYHKISLENIGEETKIVLSVTANYNNGSQSMLNIGEFFLTTMYTENGTLYPILSINNVPPLETGSITVGGENRTSTFQLTFQYPSYFKGNPCSSYSLGYPSGDINSIELVHVTLLDNNTASSATNS